MTTTSPLTLADIPVADLAGPSFREDPAAAFDEIRRKSWIVRTVRGYEVLSHEVARQMCVDPRLDSIGPDYYANLAASEPIMWYATQASLPMIEGVRHDRIRRALQGGFTRRRIDSLRPRMRAIAGRLIDKLSDRDPFDLVSGFTDRYPIEVMCALMGIPDADIDEFGSWIVDLGLLARFPLGPHMARVDAAIVRLREYFGELVAQRMRTPGDDFVSTLIAAQAAVGGLTDDELDGALLNLVFAAHDTTRYQFGWVVELMVRHGEWERLRAAPGLVPGAIEEAMRFEPALHILLRKAVADAEYRGLVLPKGALLVVNVYAANRDPAVFPDPHRFDATRANASRHLGFGYGGHLCLGHALARAEMTEALSLFLERFPVLRRVDETPRDAGLSSMSGVDRLELSVTPCDDPRGAHLRQSLG